MAVHAPVFDFRNTPLASDYTGYYVKILDDIFTSDECDDFIRLAESDDQWKEAAINYGLGKNDFHIDKEYRDSQRIVRFDHAAAERIYESLLPYVQEIVKVERGDKWDIVLKNQYNDSGSWQMVGVNERLSFLRYEEGNYFRRHCDYLPELPDGRQALATLQIYLGEDGVEGGATRIWGSNGRYIDVKPKKGRVLIFQHRGILHSGEEVSKGVKYTMRSDFLYRVVRKQ